MTPAPVQRPWWEDRDDCEEPPPVELEVVGLARVPESSQDVDPALAFSDPDMVKARERSESSPRNAPTPKGTSR